MRQSVPPLVGASTQTNVCVSQLKKVRPQLTALLSDVAGPFALTNGIQSVPRLAPVGGVVDAPDGVGIARGAGEERKSFSIR